MTLRDLYETSIELGAALDFRGQEGIRRELDRRRQEFDALPSWREPYFDRERLTNPYSDCRIVHGPEDVEVKTFLAGINIGMDEFLLADQLRSKGTKLDALVAHHTTGTGIGRSHVFDIMWPNVDILEREGVPRADAEGFYVPLMEQQWKNYDDIPNRMAPDMAKLFGFPMVQIHAPADLYFGKGVEDVLTEGRPETLGDVIRALLSIPEFDSAARIGAEPRIIVGSEDQPCGRIINQDLGGWGWPAEVYRLMGQAGVNTALRVGGSGPDVIEAAEQTGMGVIRIPHAACDNLGMNLLFDSVEERYGPLNIIACNYFERIKR